MTNLFGTPENDTLIGTEADDTLFGYAGNDLLEGQLGFDTLNGGVGNDTATYSFFSSNIMASLYTGVVSFPESTALTNTLISIENFISGQGNDVVTGNIQNNKLFGGLGDDTLSGDSGNDTLSGGDGNDLLDGGFGNDQLDGGAGNDTATYNFFAGGIIADLQTGMVSSSGNSTGNSTLSHTLANIENLIGSRGNDRITGNNLDNVLNGNAGDDILEGKGGNDTLIGELGNDIYIANDLNSTIIEEANGGIDTVNISVSYTLEVNIENLTLTGEGNLSGTGNTLNNTLVGNAFNNVLNGKEGDDTLIGGLGNEIYIVNDAGDQIIEKANEGQDIVFASVSHTLSNDIESLIFTETGDFNGTGNTSDNTIIGNAGVNTLNGRAGNDILIGAAGQDTLIGGTGADKFILAEPTDGKNRILDFSRQEGDKIVLVADSFTGLNPNNFQVSLSTLGGRVKAPLGRRNKATLGGKAKDADDRLIYNRRSGDLFYDADGRGSVAQIKIATLPNKPRLGINDFEIGASPIATAPAFPF